MWKSAKRLSAITGAALIMGSALYVPLVQADMAEEGKKIAEDRKKGNCYACHEYKDAVMPGNVGPKLENLKAKYPNKADLRARIWDESKFNPNTIMPPFGKHKIMSEDEIDKVTEFFYTL